MATLIITDGPAEGEQFSLGRHGVVLIGRDADCTFQILDPQISRRHMQIKRDDQTNAHLAVDYASRNGVRVNGSRITEPAPLGEGDEIVIGETRIVYTTADSPDAKTINDVLHKRGEGRRDTID